MEVLDVLVHQGIIRPNAGADSRAASPTPPECAPEGPLRYRVAVPQNDPRAGQPAEEAIPLLFDRYGPKIFRLAVRECGSEDDAYDVVQDTFLTAFKSWDSFEGRSKASSWLYTIAVRACRRRHRRRAGEPRHLASLDELLPGPETTIAVFDADDPHAATLRSEAKERVEEAVARLPERYRLPLVLKEIAELSVGEVAEVLGLKVATAKTRIHRARLQLRGELEAVLPRAEAPAPDHSRQVCLDLLQAKQEALDRGTDLPYAAEELCSRCRALFSTLELTHEACVDLGRGKLPGAVREALARRFDGELAGAS